MSNIDLNISIRHFQPEDVEQVKVLFQQGMRSLVPEMVKLNMLLKLTTPTWDHPWVLAVPFLAATWKYWSRDVALLLYIVSALAIKLSYLILYYVNAHKGFQSYISQSIESDLSNITSVYQNEGGCFLVATTSTNEKNIVGIVGGEFKEKNPDAGDGKRVYELRRMSVDAEMRGRGIGKLLVQRLEKELSQSRVSKIFLYCSNLQPPAQALYKSQGFQVANEIKGKEIKGFVAYLLEKHY